MLVVVILHNVQKKMAAPEKRSESKTWEFIKLIFKLNTLWYVRIASLRSSNLNWLVTDSKHTSLHQ